MMNSITIIIINIINFIKALCRVSVRKKWYQSNCPGRVQDPTRMGEILVKNYLCLRTINGDR